jgi:hypothetical protein
VLCGGAGRRLDFSSDDQAKGPSRGRSTGFDLKMRLPQTLPGWQTKELPLGPNELLTNRTTEILRFDEYVYREYSQASQNFSVYAAYTNVP